MRLAPARLFRPGAALLVIALGVAVLLPGQALVSRAAGGEPGPTVERTRTLELSGGRVLTVTAIIETRIIDPEAAMDELVPGSVPGAAGGGASAAFTVFDIWAQSDIPVTMHYSPDGAPAQQGILYTAGLVEAAIAKWNGIGSGMRLVFGELTSPTPSMCDNPDGNGDRANTIQWRTSLRSGVLGSTCTVTEGRADGSSRVVEADMVFSSRWKWSFGETTAADAYDWRSTLLHELGHVIGLGHSRVEGAVMLASLSRGVQRRTPVADDIEGVRALYGPGPPPAPKPVPQAPAPPQGLTRQAVVPILAHGY